MLVDTAKDHIFVRIVQGDEDVFPRKSFGCHVEFGLGRRFATGVTDLMHFNDFL